MDGQPTWTDCDEAGDYVVPNVLSPRDLVFRPDNMDETVPHRSHISTTKQGMIFLKIRKKMTTEIIPVLKESRCPTDGNLISE